MGRNWRVKLCVFNAGWLDGVVITVVAAVSISLLYSMIYSTAAVPYLLRFGRLRPLKYVASYYGAMFTTSLILVAAVGAANWLLMWRSLNDSGISVSLADVAPKDALALLHTAGAVAVFTAFATALLFLLSLFALMAVKAASWLPFTPLIFNMLSTSAISMWSRALYLLRPTYSRRPRPLLSRHTPG